MGSKKYPDENDFDNFVKNHGGSSNAFTDCEKVSICQRTIFYSNHLVLGIADMTVIIFMCFQTVFYFDIHQNDLEAGLDRFAQFFIEPLMKKDAVDRELNAVDSGWYFVIHIVYLSIHLIAI